MSDAAPAPTPRVLVAVVLDQNSAAVHWPALETALLAQRTELLWDVLVLDTTEIASPNYAEWLTAIKEKRLLLAGQRSRVRRLSDPERGEIQSFSDPAEQLRVGSDSAFECFIRWRSYAALWILAVNDALPAPTTLQDMWDADQLYRDRPDVVLSDENDELSQLEQRVIEESDILTDEGVALAMAKRIGLPLTVTRRSSK